MIYISSKYADINQEISLTKCLQCLTDAQCYTLFWLVQVTISAISLTIYKRYNLKWSKWSLGLLFDLFAQSKQLPQTKEEELEKMQEWAEFDHYWLNHAMTAVCKHNE